MERNSRDSNILVAIRVRPLNYREELNNQFDIVRVQDNLIIILDPVDLQFQAQNKKMLEVYHRSKEQRYTFDKVFRDHSQEQIYQQTCKPLIRSVLNGCNATVFAYGPTGAGKTYTMLGSQESQGLSVLTVRDIFESISKDFEYSYEIIITYVQIYNQYIRDLLVTNSGYLDLRDDPEKGIVIAGVTQSLAESTDQVMNLLLTGNKRRTTQATNANLTSSRSHAIFQISINKKPKAKGTQFQSCTGKLSLIDLAGSERGTVTQNRGLRLFQGAKINRSLLALANCINALGDKSKKGFFVPYRDSKLTRLLKDSLGGNCKTVMIAAMSPAGSQFQQTINTLKYANRAKNIKTKQTPNKKLVHLHISQYKNIITDLRNQIQSLKLRLNERDFYPYPQDLPKTIISEQCSCGRGEDDQEIKRIEVEIKDNFQQRIQLRRALMELQQQNYYNQMQIRKKSTDLQNFKKNSESHAVQIKNLTKLVSRLRNSTQKNNLQKEVMNLQLMQNIANTKRIRDQIPKRVKFFDRRDFLQALIKNHVLQLQNIQLEINISIQEKSIQDLKNIAQYQRKILSQNNCQFLFGQQSNDDINFDDLVISQENDLSKVQITFEKGKLRKQKSSHQLRRENQEEIVTRRDRTKEKPRPARQKTKEKQKDPFSEMNLRSHPRGNSKKK